MFCDKCGNKLWEGKSFNVSVSSTGSIPGYNKPGYNNGLGKFINNKSEWKKAAKESGAEPVG